MTSSPNHVLYILFPCTFHAGISCPSATSFLLSLVASFVVFDILESSLNWFFTLIAFDKKGNVGPIQTRLIFFGRAKSQSTCKQEDLLFRSFAIACLSVVLILDREWPLLSGLSLHNWDNNYLSRSRP